MAFLEIACFNAESAAIACEAGADRIEICHDRDSGGTTPSGETLAHVSAVASTYSLPLHAMIRPRGGDFVYSESEFEAMKAAIVEFRQETTGFVFGILDRECNIDIKRTTQLVNLAKPLPCTFHRAFDESQDLEQSLEDVITTGCSAILTAGGAASAVEGNEMLARLVKQAGGRVSIVVGGGVRSSNFTSLVRTTGAEWYHSSACLDGGDVADGQEIGKMVKVFPPQ